MQMSNEMMVLIIGEAIAFIYYIQRIDRRLAVMGNEIKWLKKHLGVIESDRVDL